MPEAHSVVAISLFNAAIFFYCQQKTIFIKKAAWLLVLLWLISALLLFQNRSAFLITAFIILVQVKARFSTLLKFTTATLLLGVVAFIFKTDSSFGRLLIWKNTIQLIKQNPFTGVGFGRFNTAYNHVQASYFSQKNLCTEEAFLATDCFYAFNEWLHAFAEGGLVIFLLILALTYCLILWLVKVGIPQSRWEAGFMLGLIIACLFNYPLHFKLIQLAAIISLLSILALSLSKKVPQKRKHIRMIACLLAFAVFEIYYTDHRTREEMDGDFITAVRLEQTGHKRDALTLLNRLEPDLKETTYFGITKAHLLFNLSKIEESIASLKETHQYYCSTKLHSTLSDYYKEKGSFAEAEQHLKTALYITPHLLETRIKLMRLYEESKQSAHALFWAKDILATPIKIKNDRALSLKNEAAVYINQYNLSKHLAE